MISTCDQKLRKTHTSRIGSYRILSKISFIVFFLNKSYFFLNFFNNFILLSRWFDNGVAQLSCIASLHFKFQVSQKIIIIRKIYFSHFLCVKLNSKTIQFCRQTHCCLISFQKLFERSLIGGEFRFLRKFEYFENAETANRLGSSSFSSNFSLNFK